MLLLVLTIAVGVLCKGRGAVDARQVQYACASMCYDEYRKYLIICLCPINSAVAPSFGCSSFSVYRGLCKNRSIDVRGRTQCYT